MAKTKEDREFLLGKELRDEEALARLKQHRLQRYNFTLGLVSGLLASCVVIVMLFAFHPGSVSDTVINDIETSFQSAEDRLGADIEQVLEETAPEEIKSLLEGIGSKTGQPANNSRPLSCKASESDRFDCWPHHYMASETLCQARNCCWNPNPSTQGVPYCFYPDDYVSYTVTHVSDSVSPPGMTATLARETASPYPSDVLQLQLDVTYETYNRLHVKV
ncbi:hypothetical protein BaRGS_00000965 [Batillaria attramentaria]|uniref:P-type domain-containing protein n=1 Tax=Batillaria attramentaria TaxID=370345 RepID=A0ABD0M8B1_9CAEN